MRANSAKLPLCQDYGTCRKISWCSLRLFLESIQHGCSPPAFSLLILTVSGLAGGISQPVLILEQETKLSPLVAAPHRFCPPMARAPQDSWAYSMLISSTPYALPHVFFWWLSAKTSLEYRNLPVLGHQLPLGRRPQSFDLATCLPQFLQQGLSEHPTSLEPGSRQHVSLTFTTVLKVVFSI